VPEVNPDLSDEGFLSDPEDEYGKFANPQLQPLSHFRSDPLLFLLGEPGSGKSTDVHREFSDSVRMAGENNESILFLDLGTVGSDAEIKKFFRSRKLLEWEESQNRLTLFLDSLDECLAGLQIVVPLLVSELRKLPVDRINVRLCCRPAELPGAVPELLANTFRTHPKTLYLAPLRRCDVADAATSFGISAVDPFVKEIVRSGAVPFATNPTTLRFLIEAYKKAGAFPSKRSELFLKGLKELCREPRDQVRRSPQESELQAEQRLVIAARIAAVSVFSNRPIIKLKSEEGSVGISDLAGESEFVGNIEVRVTAEAIAQVQKSAVFASGRFAHRTYAEFLAAWYVCLHNVPPLTVLALIVHPLDRGGHIAPQLHETTAWLASFSEAVFNHVLAVEPEILLDSDTGSLELASKEKIVAGLLARAATGDPIYRLRRGIWRLYECLSHPRLAQQLLPWLADSTRPADAREVALEIAHACSVKGLDPELLQIALNPCEPYRLRLRSTITVAEGTDEESKKELRPLTLRYIDEDPHDELKAAALTAVWPEHLSAAELFNNLAPGRSSVIGIYDSFVGFKLPQKLRRDHLLEALNWVNTLGAQAHWSPHLRLAEEIIWRAWNELDSMPELISPFARAVVARANTQDGMNPKERKQLQDSIFQNLERRRRVLLEILRNVPTESPKWLLLIFRNVRFVTHADLDWLLSEARSTQDLLLKDELTEIALRFVDTSSRASMDLLASAAEADPVIRDKGQGALSAVELESGYAKMAKETYEIQLQSELPPPPLKLDQLLTALDRTIDGDVYAWQFVIAELYREKDNQNTIWISPNVLSEAPRWKTLPREVQSAITSAARNYINNADSGTGEWIGSGQIQNRAIWGYQALELLLNVDTAWLTSLSDECWSKWAGTIVHELYGHDTEHYLLRAAYEHATKTFHDVFNQELIGELKRGLVTVNRITHIVWDNKIEQIVTRAINDKDTLPTLRATLLEDLFINDPELGLRLGAAIFEKEYGNSGRLEHASAIGAAIFRNATGAGWELLWPKMQSDAEFGLSVLEQAAHGQDSMSGLKSLSEHQLAELYVWMVRQLPYGDREIGARFVSPRDSAESLRDGLLYALKNRQTFEAVEQLQWIETQLPEAQWMKFHVRQGEDLARLGTWQAPMPSAVLAAILHDEKRMIQTSADLQNAILESLQRLERDLKAETPAIDDLWDQIARGRFRPKDEDHLSNYVKRYLERDLPKVIVGREVLIQSAYGSQSEHTDIHIDALAESGDGKAQRVTVVLESKGCWNQKLWSDIEEQLCDRYLSHGNNEGIYLVGWYNCESWDRQDYRYKSAPKMSISEARQSLRNEAQRLSSDQRRIHAFVLDCTLPKTHKVKQKRRPKSPNEGALRSNEVPNFRALNATPKNRKPKRR